MQSLRLPVRAVQPSNVGPFIPVEPQPSQVFEDAVLRLASRPLRVGVFDPQDERALVAVREEPVEQCGPRVADVQLSGRTRSKTYSHNQGARNPEAKGARGPSSATACAAIASPRPTASTP